MHYSLIGGNSMVIARFHLIRERAMRREQGGQSRNLSAVKCVLLVLPLLLSCSDAKPSGGSAAGSVSASPEQPSPPQKPDNPPAAVEKVGARTFRTTSYDTLWSFVEDDQKQLLGLPSAMAASPDLLFVVDGGLRRVTAFRTTDGSMAWSFGKQGTDEGQFSRPNAISILPDGSVAVSDLDTGRITVISVAGKLLRTLKLPPRYEMDSFCSTDGETFFAALNDGLTAFKRVNKDGSLTPVKELPWPDLNGLASFVLQGEVKAIPGSRDCIVSLLYADGIARWSPAGFVKSARFIEPIPVPALITDTTFKNGVMAEIRTHLAPSVRSATMGLSVTAHTVSVVFGGSSKSGGRLVDEYDVSDLQYRSSIMLPFPVQALTMLDDRTLVVLREVRGYPSLITLRERPSH